MKTHAVLLIVGALFASQVTAQLVQTPPIDSPINGRPVTLASVDQPKVGEGSTPDGVKVDQVFTGEVDKSNPAYTESIGAVNNEPVLQLGRKLLGVSDPTSLTDSFGLHLTGDGVQAGSGGNGATTTLSGQGGGDFNNGQLTDAHIQPHQDETTLTADGKSVSTGAGVNPDNLAGEDKPVVYVDQGRK